MRSSFYIFLIAILVQSFAWGFEYVNEKKSFENNRWLSTNIGLGITQFINSKGVDGSNPGLAMQVGIGHQFTQWLGADIVYQLSTFRFNSPDPISPSETINTRAGLNQEFIRLKAYYPAVVAQPYISAGFGGYQFFGVNGSTDLSLEANFMIPVGAGVRAYVYKNDISIDFDFTYHMFMGENQDPLRLLTLRLKEVSMNMYSLIGGFTFHFL